MTLRQALRGEDGFTLAEMLVVIAILGMMMAAVFGTLDISQKAYTRASASEDAQAGVRGALDRIVSDFRLIGSFYTGSGNASQPITHFVPHSTITFWGDVNADTASVTISGGTTTVTEAKLTSQASASTTATSTTVTITAAASGTSGSTGFTPAATGPTCDVDVFNTSNGTTTYTTPVCGEMLYLGNGSVREAATVTGVSGDTVTVSGGLMKTYAADSLVRSVEQVKYTYTAGANGTGTLTRTTAADGEQTLLDNVVSFTMVGYDYGGCATPNRSATTGVCSSAAIPTTAWTTNQVAAIEEIEVSLTTQGAGGGPTGASRRTMTIRVRLRVVPTS